MWRQRAGLGNTTSKQCRHQKPDRIRVWTDRRRVSSRRRNNSCGERHRQKIRSERGREKTADNCESLTWSFCIQQCNLLLPVKCLLAHTSPLEKDYNLSSLSFEGLRPALHSFTSRQCWNLNRGRLQPPSSCAMSLSPAAPCCGLCWVLWQHSESLLPLWALTGWWDSPAHLMPSMAPMGPPQPERPTGPLWASTAAV